MTEIFGEAWPPMSVPDLAPDDDETKTQTKLPIFSLFYFLRFTRLPDN